MKDLIGRQLGNFVVKAPLGAGAMGEVYVGEHVILGHKVAIKVMQASSLAHHVEESTQRFITEARVLTEIGDSPHVIKLFDFGEIEGRMLYYVMEYLEGHDLEEELHGKLPLTPRQVLPYIDAIGAGLAAAHAKKIIHRDLKPANIFVVTSGETRILKLIDFGLAKDLGSKQKLTIGGMGTPIYSAPEQVMPGNQPIGPATDIYALGVLVYQMLTGSIPFDIPADAHPYAVLLAPTKERRVPLCERRPELPASIGDFVDGSLARHVAKRPATVMDFLAGYRRALVSAGVVSVPPMPSLSSVQTIPPLGSPKGKKGIFAGLFPTQEDNLEEGATLPLASDAHGAEQESTPLRSSPKEEVVEAVSRRSEPESSSTRDDSATFSSSLSTSSPLSTLSSSTGESLSGSREPRGEPRGFERVKLLIGSAIVLATLAFFWATRGARHASQPSRSVSQVATKHPGPPPKKHAAGVTRGVSVPLSWASPPGVPCSITLDGVHLSALPRFLRVRASRPSRLYVVCPGFVPIDRVVHATDAPLVLTLVARGAMLSPREKPRSVQESPHPHTPSRSSVKKVRRHSFSRPHAPKREETKLPPRSSHSLPRQRSSSLPARNPPRKVAEETQPSSEPTKLKSSPARRLPDDDPGDVVGP